MQWLLDLGATYRQEILNCSNFYRYLESVASREQIQWCIRQLYYQSRDFTSALSLRYAHCKDSRYQATFSQHANEEIDHCEQLVVWMRKNNFLQPDEAADSIRPTIDTQCVSAHCFRSILKESYTHQILTMNLVGEGVSYDFFCHFAAKLEQLGLPTGRYWHVHREVDLYHLRLGLDLIPQYAANSPGGEEYAQIVAEAMLLYRRMLDSWVEPISYANFPRQLRSLPKLEPACK